MQTTERTIVHIPKPQINYPKPSNERYPHPSNRPKPRHKKPYKLDIFLLTIMAKEKKRTNTKTKPVNILNRWKKYI